MNEKELVKKVFDDIELVNKEKQIAELKIIVQKTLEKIKTKESLKEQLEKEIKILKQDIDNLKSGRLDILAERQEKDKEAKRVSIIIIKKIVEKQVPFPQPYYVPVDPYRSNFPWNQPWAVTCGDGGVILDGVITRKYTSGSYVVNYNSADGNNVEKTVYLN